MNFWLVPALACCATNAIQTAPACVLPAMFPCFNFCNPMSSIEDEYNQAMKELLARRAQRMKELYEAESAQFSKELADMGLVIAGNKP